MLVIWFYNVLIMLIIGFAAYRLVSGGKYTTENALWGLGNVVCPFLLAACLSSGPTSPALVALLALFSFLVIVILDIGLLKIVADYAADTRMKNVEQAKRAKLVLMEISVVAFLAVLASVFTQTVTPIGHFIFLLYAFGTYLLWDNTCHQDIGKGLL